MNDKNNQNMCGVLNSNNGSQVLGNVSSNQISQNYSKASPKKYDKKKWLKRI